MKVDTVISRVGMFPHFGARARAATVGFCLSVLAGTAPAGAATIRNVILCVGDGMGPGQVAAARCYAGTNLVFESFPYQSNVSTLSAGGGVTDSAAAATALATGRKVYNGVVSLAMPGGGEELETALERFSRLGKSTGLVTTSYLTDATPACFGAHISSRWNWAAIADDYLARSRPNVLFGGGGCGLSEAAARAAGYLVVTNAETLAALREGEVSHAAGLFGVGALPFECDGLGDRPTLTQMATAALDLLSRDPDGFFLMAEGGLIDIACHGSDLYRCVTETLAFNEMVRAVAAWAEGREDTLVLVAADHETGGLSVLADNGAGVLPTVAWRSVGGHSATPVTVCGQGVNAELAGGIWDNTQVNGIIFSRVPEVGECVKIERVSQACTVTRWATVSGGVYRVEHAATLEPSAWHPCATVISRASRVSIVHTNEPASAQGFYRMVPE